MCDGAKYAVTDTFMQNLPLALQCITWKQIKTNTNRTSRTATLLWGDQTVEKYWAHSSVQFSLVPWETIQQRSC